jgi:hypothetical protein
MSAEQARRRFDDLCDTYYRLAPLHGPAVEGPTRLEHRLAVRKAMQALARSRGSAR